jgi:hypothetical protein
MSIAVKTETEVVTSASTPVREVGICATCNHSATCLFLQATRRAVWFCDEFDATGSAAPQLADAPLPKPSERYFGEAIAVGLCVSCDARQDCGYRKPGVTIAHCENFS